MRIFFDFEKFRIQIVDAVLCDLLIAIKSELIIFLKDYKDQIEGSEGFILIAVNSSYGDGVYFYFESELKKQLNEAIKGFDLQSIIKKYTKTSLN